MIEVRNYVELLLMQVELARWPALSGIYKVDALHPVTFQCSINGGEIKWRSTGKDVVLSLVH